MKQAMCYIWDNYIEYAVRARTLTCRTRLTALRRRLSDATQVVLISHGSAGRAIVDLITARRQYSYLASYILLLKFSLAVRHIVKAVVQVAAVHEPVPLPAISEDLKDWFKQVCNSSLPSRVRIDLPQSDLSLPFPPHTQHS